MGTWDFTAFPEHLLNILCQKAVALMLSQVELLWRSVQLTNKQNSTKDYPTAYGQRTHAELPSLHSFHTRVSVNYGYWWWRWGFLFAKHCTFVAFKETKTGWLAVFQSLRWMSHLNVLCLWRAAGEKQEQIAKTSGHRKICWISP